MTSMGATPPGRQLEARVHVVDGRDVSTAQGR